MAQLLKEHVRQGFVTAAGETFAERGFEATTMAEVAERAGSSVGNLYKYFASNCCYCYTWSNHANCYTKWSNNFL